MRYLFLFFIPYFIYASICPQTYDGLILDREELTNTSTSSSFFAGCSGSSCPPQEPLPDPVTRIDMINPTLYNLVETTYTYEPFPDGWSIYKHNSTKTYQCFYTQCDLPDEDYPYDVTKFREADNTSPMSSCDDPATIDLRMFECSAAGGSYVATSRTNCCTTSTCLVPISENNCTVPYVQDPATNECVCDTSSGYSVDTKTGECTDCSNTYECVLSADNSNGTYTNIYEVTDCNGVNYAEKTIIENFNCMTKNCPPGQYYCDVADICQLNGTECLADGSDDNNDTGTCDYPATMFGLPFQAIMSLNDCLSHDGWTSFCDDFTVACYYEDSNNTDSDNSDSTSSDTDDNTTSTVDDNLTTDANGTIIDTTNIENKLDQIIAELSPTGSINQSIGDLSNSINNNFMSLSDKLDSINRNQGAKLDTIGTKIDSAASSLGSKLDGVNRNLSDIKDKLNESSDDQQYDMEDKANELGSVIDQAIAAYETNFADITSIIQGIKPPSFSTSGSCDLSVSILGKTLDIGSGFRDALPVLRPVVMFILNLIFTFILIRLSILAYRDIAMRAFGLFG